MDGSGDDYLINLGVGIVDQMKNKYAVSPKTVKNDNNFCLNTYFSNLAYNLFNLIAESVLEADLQKRCFDELTDPNFLFYNEQLTKQRMALCDNDKNNVHFTTQAFIVHLIKRESLRMEGLDIATPHLKLVLETDKSRSPPETNDLTSFNLDFGAIISGYSSYIFSNGSCIADNLKKYDSSFAAHSTSSLMKRASTAVYLYSIFL
ncbi:predicted protein [Chaetoceros tenuissimus]|uniref:Uncharacterized protein n=1 Tax=Chaetoceros tenuissimus TaxID=426638 RepID=A0AAD3CEN3_9STRA|nr:predicted protein [Chaetoceros tenuissimus]